MKRVDLVDMYHLPASYQPPADSHLSYNTQYPNLNSREYEKRPADNTLKVQKFHETIEVNELGNVVLACNDYTARTWNGSFWGFESIDDFGNEQKASYKLRNKAAITNLKYVEAKLLLLSDASGLLELWSTAAEVRSKHGYCLFNVGHQSQHVGIVVSMDLCRADPTKALTGASDGCLKVWDIGAGDLCSLNTFDNAHAGSICAISSSPISAETFVTCSRDRSVCMWDKRLTPRPVIAYADNLSFAYTCVYWSKVAECAEQILVGDETGCIYVLDSRNMRTHVNRAQPCESAIHKMQFNDGNLLAVLEQSSRLQVLNAANDEFGKVIYDNRDAFDCVRSVHWTAPRELVATGWDSQLRKHAF